LIAPSVTLSSYFLPKSLVTMVGRTSAVVKYGEGVLDKGLFGGAGELGVHVRETVHG
jgi:hypothetical protein